MKKENRIAKLYYNKKMMDCNILAVSTSKGYELIELDSIIYLQAENCYTNIFLSDSTKIMASKNLGYYEKKLYPKNFIRIHHSFLVNLIKIKRFINAGSGKISFTNEKLLPVSRGRKAELLRIFNQMR